MLVKSFYKKLDLRTNTLLILIISKLNPPKMCPLLLATQWFKLGLGFRVPSQLVPFCSNGIEMGFVTRHPIFGQFVQGILPL